MKGGAVGIARVKVRECDLLLGEGGHGLEWLIRGPEADGCVPHDRTVAGRPPRLSVHGLGRAGMRV